MQSTPYRWTFGDGRTVVVKTHETAPSDWFDKEAEGLRTLAQHALRVPAVIASGPGYLVLEDLGATTPDGGGTPQAWEHFGRALAQLHRVSSDRHGWAHDNYLGILPQTNGQHEDGIEFFIEHRVLRYYPEWGCEKYLTPQDRRAIENICNELRRNAPHEKPSLLHGDLHSGNTLARATANEIATFDPAVYFGLREVELSLAEQFGGFPEPFWRAYDETFPLAAGWKDRLPLYRLKEHLGLIAQFGIQDWYFNDFRALLARFA